MTDREKVIRALEVCSSISDGEKCPKECPYMGQDVYCIGSSGIMLDALDLLKEQPELVRCEDCKHGEPSCNGDAVFCTKDIGTIYSSIHKPDWFCADGERK